MRHGVSAGVRCEVLAYISLGANLGDAQSTVKAAIQAVAILPNTRLEAVSSLYQTAPMEASGPNYINAVVAISTRLDMHQLLSNLISIENQAGRERPYHNAPRTLDLDILMYGKATVNSPTLVLPHPRMWHRAFVLVPLAEIAPEVVSAEALEAVVAQGFIRLLNVVV